MKSLLAFKSGLHDPAGRLASWNISPGGKSFGI